ncbi:hypothetical protein CDAR_526881 [Caerostris darwini]|uniref:Uncharacterized protein n=1 Tax=Caerostris darwini TaxID=1538125 RepID=A0AAV4Q5D1_9ARAC|nr:hypothetical protein CDAR_526881 [Caerostris darwini]
MRSPIRYHAGKRAPLAPLSCALRQRAASPKRRSIPPPPPNAISESIFHARKRQENHGLHPPVNCKPAIEEFSHQTIFRIPATETSRHSTVRRFSAAVCSVATHTLRMRHYSRNLPLDPFLPSTIPGSFLLFFFFRSCCLALFFSSHPTPQTPPFHPAPGSKRRTDVSTPAHPLTPPPLVVVCAVVPLVASASDGCCERKGREGVEGWRRREWRERIPHPFACDSVLQQQQLQA